MKFDLGSLTRSAAYTLMLLSVACHSSPLRPPAYTIEADGFTTGERALIFDAIDRWVYAVNDDRLLSLTRGVGRHCGASYVTSFAFTGDICIIPVEHLRPYELSLTMPSNVEDLEGLNTIVGGLDDIFVSSLGRQDEATFEHTIEHELGHAFGLQHSDSIDSVMFPYFPGAAEHVTPRDVRAYKDLRR